MAPTWDLFILVFFAIIVAYSFIIGRNATLKIIIASYISILATDGLGNLIDHMLLAENPVIDILTTANSSSLIILKILIFVLTIVILTVRGRFFVDIGREHSLLISLAITGTFGLLSAGLIVSTVLIYMSGGNFVGETASFVAGVDITRESYLARTLTDNYNFWFSVPALAFVVASFVGDSDSSAEEV